MLEDRNFSASLRLLSDLCESSFFFWDPIQPMRDRELVERVRDATDLLALVGQAVKLRKQGSAHVGLCPFHAERSPSFQVIPARGFYHCFGCD